MVGNANLLSHSNQNKVTHYVKDTTAQTRETLGQVGKAADQIGGSFQHGVEILDQHAGTAVGTLPRNGKHYWEGGSNRRRMCCWGICPFYGR